MIRHYLVLALLFFLVGCGQGPHPRLSALLDMQEEQQANSQWPPLDRVGLIVHSDTTGPEAAPAISHQFLETLSLRTEEWIMRRCQVPAVERLTFPLSTQPGHIKRELIARGQDHNLTHILLVVLSSRESSGPTTLGEERMMTQMSATSIENTALSEVVLLRLADYTVMWNFPGTANETLELLNAPIGKDQLTRGQSLEILRAQAAQQALDRSLFLLSQHCEAIPRK